MNVTPIFRPAPIDGKVPASDTEAEAATLTACMNVPTVAALAMSVAGPEDYYSGLHREIARAIADLLEAGQAPQPGNVMLRLRETGRMAVVGGERAIVDMMNSVPAVSSMIERYATKVHDLAQVRRVGEAMHRLLAECYGPVPDVGGFLARVDATIGEATRRRTEKGVTTALDAAKEVARELAAAPRKTITTGFRSLDALTQGFERSALYILAARTSMGKTAMALQMVAAAAEAGHRVLVISMEMPRAQLMRRMLCARAKVPLSVVKARHMSPVQWSAFTLASSDLGKLAISMADGSGQSLLDVKSAVRAHKPDLLVVDHIGLMRPSATSSGSKRSREQEVAEFSRGLKGLALETGIPVLALCQVGRDVAKGARRPGLSDLRESGAIEQDADGVWMIHRPGYYDPRSAPEIQRQAELVVAKQRDGETKILMLEWDGASATFHDPEAE